MSMWTHLTACLSIDTCIAEKRSELRRQIKEFLKSAPKITGSEGNAEIFINIKSGHNYSTNYDCEHCKYSDTLKDVIHEGREYQECDAPDGYDNCSATYQTCVVISIQGDLRDRRVEQTTEEFKDFLKYVESNYIIRDYSINIEGE